MEVNYKKQLYLAGLLFTLHNVEEFIGFARFKFAAFSFGDIFNKKAMLFSIVAITLVAWGIIVWGNYKKSEELKRKLLTVFSLVFLVNAFFLHIILSVIFRMYFPALITSVVLYLPYSFIMLPKLYKSYPSKKGFYRTALLGLLIVGLIAFFLQALGNIVT